MLSFPDSCCVEAAASDGVVVVVGQECASVNDDDDVDGDDVDPTMRADEDGSESGEGVRLVAPLAVGR